ncbi:TPA: LPS export ABC transporter periplasmic protein LptC [Candidatus Gastranaerophilales bacterium HUM_2]|jgi:LPS export ABC transporter protein LptC|nr:MAG TPA: LPS export ABC transporter periplasmic protein LptC [Candidatus Gastranaerophilales bacterium HUM_2]
MLTLIYMDLLEKIKNLSKKQKAYVGAFCAIVALLAWAFISAGVITHNFNRSQLQTDQDRQEASIDGIILTETKNEKKYWEIYGETGNYDSKNGVAMLDNVIGNFYDDENQVSMSFESSKGTYNEKKEQIILYEDTFIVLKDLTTLRANRLIWSGKDIPTIAEGNVRITRKNELLSTAEKVEISPDYETFKIIGNAVSKVYSDKEIK